MLYHISLRGNLHYLLTCKALGETRVTTRKCFLKNLCCLFNCKAVGGSRVKGSLIFHVSWGGNLPYLITCKSAGWDESYHSKKLHVKNLCCLLNCKAFGGSRVKTRWCIMYLGGQLALCTYLLGLGWEKSHTKKILVQKLVLFTLP